MDNIIFGYKRSPSSGYYDFSDGSFSIEVYEDGTMLYTTYLFDSQEQDCWEIPVKARSIRALKWILWVYRKEIARLDTEIDNGSLDGDCNAFILNGRPSMVYNIGYGNEIRPDGSTDRTAHQQNVLLKIFDKAARALRKSGIMLGLDDVDFLFDIYSL